MKYNTTADKQLPVLMYVHGFLVLDLYTKYNTMEAVRKSLPRLHALCSTKDELIGSCHVDALAPVMPNDRIMVVDDFGHQCRDAGLKHLYNIIEDLTDKE